MACLGTAAMWTPHLPTDSTPPMFTIKSRCSRCRSELQVPPERHMHLIFELSLRARMRKGFKVGRVLLLALLHLHSFTLHAHLRPGKRVLARV